MNILFASIEDLNDWIEPLGGHPQVKTPNLSRLAARGMLFRHAYAPVPACSPSRTAALFGQAPWRTGVYSNGQKWTDAYPKGQRLSVIGALRDAGYRTEGAGKIFHLDTRGIDPDDWDRYHRKAAHLKYPPISRATAEGKMGPLGDFGPAPDDRPDFDRINTDWICNRIQPGADGQVWGFGLYRPHLPFIAPQAFFDLYAGPIDPPPGLGMRRFRPGNEQVLEGLPDEARSVIRRFTGRVLHRSGEYEDYLRAYLASVSYADALLGEVLDRLEETGQAETTLVVLWSDHGWQFGEKLAFRKFTLWERALRVPLIFAGPGVGRGVCEEPVSLLDLYPTLMAQSGAAAKHVLDGCDLSPALRGDPWQRPAPVISAWGAFEDAQDSRMAFSLRSRSHRYTLYWNGGEELYDSEADPFEHRNLLAEEASGNLRALADSYQASMNAAIPSIAGPAGG